MKNIYQNNYHINYSQELIARKHLLDFVKTNIKIKNKIILDAGCNGGFLSFYLVKSGAKKVYGLDMSPGFIKTNKKNAEDKKLSNRLNFRVGNIEKMPYKNEFFDFIICSEVIEHVRKPKMVASEFYRILKKGGMVLVTTPNILNPMEFFHNIKHYLMWLIKNESITHIQHFTFSSLKSLFSKYFKVTKCLGIGMGAAFLPFSRYGFLKKTDYLLGLLLQPISFDIFLLLKKL